MSHLLYTVENGVAYLTMNRPEVRNALSMEMREELLTQFQRLETDTSVRCVVLKGQGDHFMAGGDIKSFMALTELTPNERRSTFITRIHNNLNNLIATIQRLNKPVIASVNGAAAGAGISMALSCDLVIAAEDAFFTLAYAHIGCSPDGGATYYLPRLVGTKKAMEIALFGDRFSAQEAKELGMINRVVPTRDLEAQTRAMAERLANGPSKAYGNIKKLINRSLDNPLEQQLHEEAVAFGDTTTAEDWVEGVRAFNEKRKPVFKGV